jgi:protein-L-isoaspartate O-methyltransferase
MRNCVWHTLAARASTVLTEYKHGCTLSTCPLQDHPLAIGEGQTISAPHMHAICLELLEHHLTPGARVLDVGSGAAMFSHLIGPHAVLVVTVMSVAMCVHAAGGVRMCVAAHVQLALLDLLAAVNAMFE